MCVLLILSGISGVAAGDQSATAGWWLIVLFSTLLFLTFVGGRSRDPSTGDSRTRTRRSRLLTAGVAVLAIVVTAPVIFAMLLGGG